MTPDSFSPSTPTQGSDAYGIAPPGYRLPASTRIGRVRLQVSDLERSLRFYREVLGFAVLERSGSLAALGPRGDGAALIELHERPGAAPVPHRGRLGLFHFAVLLPDRAALGRLVAHLAEVGARVGASDHLVSEALYLNDPDGLGIEVYADRPRSDWRHQGRQLVMATEPLDVASVVRAGGDQPWTGMPEGTVIGHVHLHVGDLDEADGFFHAALGLDRVVWNYPGALFLSAGGYHHHLGLNTWAGARAARPAEGDARLLDWELVLPDGGEVERAARSLASRGFESAPAEGGGRTVTDPWGTTLRLAISAED